MQPLAESSLDGKVTPGSLQAVGRRVRSSARSIGERHQLGPAAEWRQSLRTGAQHLSEFALPHRALLGTRSS